MSVLGVRGVKKKIPSGKIKLYHYSLVTKRLNSILDEERLNMKNKRSDGKTLFCPVRIEGTISIIVQEGSKEQVLFVGDHEMSKDGLLTR